MKLPSISLPGRGAALVPRMPMRRDRAPVLDVALRHIAGNLTATGDMLTAWFEIPEIHWAFRGDLEREQVITAIAEQCAQLAGYRVRLRRTTVPFPIRRWLQHLNEDSRPLPDVVGAPTWMQHLVRSGNSVQAGIREGVFFDGRTMLGVEFARRTVGDAAGDLIRRRFGKGGGLPEADRVAEQVAELTAILGGQHGLCARPATRTQVIWLLYRSVGLGLTPPAHLASGFDDDTDVAALTEWVQRVKTPYGKTVEYVNTGTGQVRHVAVLTVGQMKPMSIPQRHQPWLHLPEQVGFPVEISSTVDFLGPEFTEKKTTYRRRLIENSISDHHEHGEHIPPHMERAADLAVRIGDEIATGQPVDAVRAWGWHRLAVYGDTVDETMKRARELTELYQRHCRTELQHPQDQILLCDEFVPGQPLASRSYQRKMPVKMFAAAVPHAAPLVGTRTGHLIGYTAGVGCRPVLIDSHYPMEVQQGSGVGVIVAKPGGGKSTLMGALAYLNARSGTQTTLLDPSGPLARLGGMPELAPHTRVLDLVRSKPGTLAPYALVPTPDPNAFDQTDEGWEEYQEALAGARSERRLLALDICQMLLPPQMAEQYKTVNALRAVIRDVPAEPSTTLNDLIDALEFRADSDSDPDVKEIALTLRFTQEVPLARLFFGRPPAGALTDAPLTIITMAGLTLPDLKIDRRQWTSSEALAVPMWHLAHLLAVRRCYSGPMARRKWVGLDESHVLNQWPSGRAFLVRVARDSRKWNLAALLASQNPDDILTLDVENLVAYVLVGQLVDNEAITAGALKMLRVAAGRGYEEVLAGLSLTAPGAVGGLGYREFVYRDTDGRVEKIRVDLAHHLPELLNVLNTNPGGSR